MMRQLQSVRYLLLLGLLGAVAPGCAGARSALSFETVTVPVSMSSRFVHKERGIVRHQQYDAVGPLLVETHGWGMFFSAIPLTPTLDFSEEINAEVMKKGGDAVVNLKITSNQCALNYFIFFSLIPIWPGCVSVKVEGTIVKLRAGAPEAAPPPASQPTPAADDAPTPTGDTPPPAPPAEPKKDEDAPTDIE